MLDENTETIDSYVIQIRQVANHLGYGEPQILEVFKNTLPTKLYWILFPIEDLRQAVDTAKRILTKEKLDKQLTGQTSTSPFISVRDGTERRVSFSTKDELEDKIDKLTVMMSKLAAKDNHERKPFKLQIYKSRGRNRSYGQGGYQNRSDSRSKLMNGRDDTTTFLPLDFRIGGQNRDSCPTVGQYLTREQTRYIYKKVETGEMINMDTIQQEIEQEKQ